MNETTTKRTAARAVADIGGGTILATVDIAVPGERVWKALTSEEVTRWWGSPETYQTSGWTADVRVGGRWEATGKMSDGRLFSVGGEYLEVDRPTRLVYSWKPDWDGGAVTTVSYQLEPISGGTRVTLRHDGFAGRADSQRNHARGWEAVLGWLARHLMPAEAPPGKFFVCKLHGPRPSFPADATESERRVMQEHVVYWGQLLAAGKALLFGPVAEPTAVWGLGVLEVADEAAAQAIVAADPTVKSGMGFRMEAYPMLQAVVRRD